ncbi:hypothetical protein H5410_046989 [Solanum commersonii]|uniref:Replication factor A C-terminal domain-containing protein n=1 Tax=Solanum commersonii TaxID=4109 RepID=A0A9J5XDU9_SOLCO|nr:hypothetical protein H5410_046989 [Solanum commersonii]
MTSPEELENRCLPISKLKKYANEWVIKVLVIRLSLTKEYKNAKRYDRKVMTLWGDFAQIEGQMLQSLESDKPVLAFCDVKSSIYQGDFVLSTTPISSLLINPQFEKANNLQEWNDNMKAQKIDLSLMPSRLMQTARQVKITNILNGSLAIVKDMYYKFNATVSGIDNNTDPWYHACKKCYRRVTVINSTATCTYCRTEDIDYEARYRLKIDVTDEDQFLRITLFDAAKYFLGCGRKDYVLYILKEESEYYRKLVLSKGKEFSILVKIDRNFPNVEPNMNVIAMEIHEVPKNAADQTKVKTSITKQRSKRMKKQTDNEKMKEIVAHIPHVEKILQQLKPDIESPQNK